MSGVERAAYVATFGTETNSFIEFPTTEADFEHCCLFRKGRFSDPPNYLSQLQILLATLLRQKGYDVTHGLCAFGKVSGPLTADTYDTLTREIFDEVRAARPAMILMFVHGAMIAEGLPDAEGTFLRQLRTIAGPDTVIGCVLDLHVNLSEQMLQAADLLIGCKEYPHDDFPAAAQALVDLADRTRRGEVTPVTATFDCRMIGLFSTKSEPMKTLVDAFRSKEAAGEALQIWAAHGFPWSDTEDTSYKIVVTTDGDAARASQIAADLGRRVYAVRDRLPMTLHRPEDIERLPRDRDRGPLVLGDIADNPMGGAPGDATHLLRHLIYEIDAPTAFATILDPGLVRQMRDAAPGTPCAVELGGKISRNSGSPISDDAEMLGYFNDKSVVTANGASALGDCCLIRIRQATIIVASIPVQVFSSAYFTDFGLDLAAFDYVGVKSTQQFASFFGEQAGGFGFISTPGALAQDYSLLDYRHVPTASTWPLAPDPLPSP